VSQPGTAGRETPTREDLQGANLLPSRRLLDPGDRASEILFGLIMVISITGTISVATGGQEEVGTMLRAAIGCNLAWGITDGVMYLLSALILRGRGILALRAIRRGADDATARAVIEHVLPPAVARVLTPEELDGIRRRLCDGPEPPPRPPLGAEDFLGALAVAALVFLSTFPVVIPFLVMDEAGCALRASNGIAIAMLFVLGWLTGRSTGARPWKVALLMVALGVGLVALVIALGG
jgi:VIT1/CCC1 family predicted Fe2+/Mn2+ transporter